MLKRDLSQTDIEGAIRCSMFLKEKVDNTGELKQLKARLVAGGNMQDLSLYDNVSSPTLSITGLYSILQLAVYFERTIVTADITSAYLNANMPESTRIVMKIDKNLAGLLCKAESTYLPYVTSNGELFVILKKALYGCVESAKLWYEELTNTLKSYGFVPNPYEPCLLNKGAGERQVTIGIYVDDLIMSAKFKEDTNSIIGHLERHYGRMATNGSNTQSYLGIALDLSTKGVISASMNSFTREVVQSWDTNGKSNTPAGANLFEISESTPVPEDLKRLFHTTVAQLLYLSKRTRPDILVATTFLTTRVSEPTEEDIKKLRRVLKYLNGTQDLKLNFAKGDNLSLVAYIDASYAIHYDCKSHTGGLILLGGSTIYTQSSKQSLNAKSSTEAEIIALSDVCGQVTWIRQLLQAQGVELQATNVYEDNMSVLTMVRNGRPTTKHSRHINIRFFHAHDLEAREEIVVKFVPTESQLADFFTKPIQGTRFKTLRDTILGATPDV